MPTSLPISAFAQWPVPNQDKGTLINAFFAWTVALDFIFVVARVITRKWIVSARLWCMISLLQSLIFTRDDYFIITAMVGTLIGAALDACEVHYGFGRHEKYLDDQRLTMFGEYTYLEWIQTFLTLMSTKVSICFFLLRIPTSKNYIRPLQASIAALIVSNIILTFIWIFQCDPVQLAWNASLKGRCFGRQFLLNLILSQAIISVFSDFALALFPIVIIRNLHMRTRQKLGLSLLMGLGVITGTCCLIRTTLNGGALPIDGTFGGITNWFWRQFEVQLGIVCACIPPLIPCYKWLKQKFARSPKPKETTSVSQNGPGDGATLMDPSTQGPADGLHQPRRGRQRESSVPRSENRFLGPGRLRRDTAQNGLSEEGQSIQHTEGRLPQSVSHRDGADAAAGSVAVPEPAAQPAHTHNRSRNMSFSRRDLRTQAPLHHDADSDVEDLPLVHITPQESNPHSYEDRPTDSPGSQEMVKVTGDPKGQLEFVGLQPSFERSRGLFAHILGLKRSSWSSWASYGHDKSNTGPGLSEVRHYE